MIRRRARIVAIDGRTALLAVHPEPACARCEAGVGCGQGLLFRWFARRTPDRLRVRVDERARVGQSVTLELTPAALTGAAWIVYGLPLVLLLAGLALGDRIGGDPGAALGGALALAASVGLLRAPPVRRRLAAGPLGAPRAALADVPPGASRDDGRA